MHRVYVFPGQGSQVVGMGAGLWDRFPKEVEQASDILGYSVQRLCMEDPEGKLGITDYTQPALYTVCALTYLDHRQNQRAAVPDAVAGHSLGEYAALFASGAFDFATGLRLVRKRGALMGQARDGGMAAVIGMESQRVAEVLEKAGLTDAEIANDNSPSQLVISGPITAVRAACEALKSAGARHCMELKVSAAFHSKAMAPAAAAFRRFVDPVEFGKLNIPVIANVTARPYEQSAIHDLLSRQIGAPVRWRESVRYMMDQGATDFIEVGPGNVLTGLIQQTRRAVAA